MTFLNRGSKSLAAILFSDVESFTSRMAENESHVLALVQRDFQCMTELCQHFDGRVIKSTGDGLIMCFNSAEKAVLCAVQIQAQLMADAKRLAAEDVLRHRIGIHLGEITFTSNDVMGSGVNIAARLQGQAPSGGICISQTVYDVIKSNSAVSIKAIGEKQLKGIKEPMVLYHIDLPEETVKKIAQENQERTISAKQKYPLAKQDSNVVQSSRSLPKVLLTSLIVTGLITALRYLGVLQPLELWAFNQMMQLRPTESLDKRITVITIDDDDRRIYGDNIYSISDESLEKLLTILEKHKPRVIGLDLYRDSPEKTSSTVVSPSLQRMSNVVGICKISDPTVGSAGIAPPQGLPSKRVGFSDFIEDIDGVLRRQILALKPDAADPCQTSYALSVLLAFQYLKVDGFNLKWTSDQQLQIGSVIFPKLRSHFGGYQGINATNQILINFRSQLLNPGSQITLTQVLTGNVSKGAFEDRVVLIGVVSPQNGDQWKTVYSWQNIKTIPGVMVHAHVVSQMLSAVKDNRPLIWAWPQWIDVLWLLGWGGIGMLIVRLGQSFIWLGVGLGIASLTLYSTCFLVLTIGGWLPFIPSMLVLIGVISWGMIARIR